MMLGLRDYVRKNGFTGIVLGLSGGIDSALTAAVAVDALGADRVRGVRLPSRFTSQASMDDAADSAARLGITLETMAIGQAVEAAEAALAPVFGDRERDVTEENLQARVRGLLLMGLSNKFGELLVTTGNKSEMSVGYATLYGDMCGGYSVLKDIYKTEVYALAEWRNTHVPEDSALTAIDVIPQSSITKAPTAELRPNQTDQDSLPPYDVLDAILHGLIEEEESVDQIVARGFDRATVSRVQRLLYSAEYKRRQAPPGVKITRKSFGRDRRYPMTNAFENRFRGFCSKPTLIRSIRLMRRCFARLLTDTSFADRLVADGPVTCMCPCSVGKEQPHKCRDDGADDCSVRLYHGADSPLEGSGAGPIHKARLCTVLAERGSLP